MARSWGETLARLVANRISNPVATTAAITALPAAERSLGMQILETTTGTTWWFDSASTAPAGPSVLVPDAGTGRWHSTSGGMAPGIGAAPVTSVRARTTGALAANTRTGNVITADGNGALGAQDGVTLVAGERLLVVNEVAGADNGPYQVTQIGSGALPYILTRVGEADSSAEVTAGMLHYISEGTLFGNEWAYLTTNDAITLNTTSLAYAMVPNLVDLASLANGLGLSLLGLEDAATNFTATDGEAAFAEMFSVSASADVSITTRVSTEESTSLSADASILATDLGANTPFQVAGGTFVDGTATISAGIIVTANTDAFVVMSAVVTGSTNVGGVAHLKASNVVGGAGVGEVVLNILGADGLLDADAAGAFRVLLVN